MNHTYHIVLPEKPPWGVLGQGLRDFNQSQAGPDNYESMCFVLEGPEQEVLGGFIGATYWDWFYVDVLWVREELRGQGYGSRLLARAEEEARQRGAKHAYLDTFSFQAPAFYMRHGYQEFGRLAGFPEGHTRYFLSKRL